MVEKIEQLTDSMNELQDNIMDINETSNTDVIQFDPRLCFSALIIARLLSTHGFVSILPLS